MWNGRFWTEPPGGFSFRRSSEPNARGSKAIQDDLHKQQQALRHDAVVLKGVIATGKKPEHDSMEINFHIHRFDDVSWKTAQSTGALSYMTYGTAQEYANLYNTQAEFDDAGRQGLRDADPKDPPLTREQAGAIKEKIDTLQAQLLLVDALVKDLDQE